MQVEGAGLAGLVKELELQLAPDFPASEYST
jgi:hypothetical protein